MGRQKIIFLGPAWPYRGGIATIIETLARVFSARGADVSVLTFRVQYPRVLFPGKSQFRDGPPPAWLGEPGAPIIERRINTINPFNWIGVGRLIRREAPDAVILKYWTPFMAPCFGTIARVARRKKRKPTADTSHSATPRFIVQLDNIIPHERRWFDGPLTRYFVGSMDGFVYMSEQVGRELAEFDTTKPHIYSPHPMFDHFGAPVPRKQAAEKLEEKLDLAPGTLDTAAQYVMFFGLVRAYKGLDLLLEAWAQIIKGSKTASPRKLLIAGEFYDDISKYRAIVETLGLTEDVIIQDRFVPDSEVPLWFSVADLLVLPYRTATQSGVTQIAFHFDLPMVVTDVGGLPEIVRDGVTGYVASPTAESIAAAIDKALAPAKDASTPSSLAVLRANFPSEKRRFSWDAAADALEKVWKKA